MDTPQSLAPISVACNSECVIILFEDGTSSIVELSSSTPVPEIEFSTPAQSPGRVVVQITCNSTHAYILLNDGKLYQYVNQNLNSF